MNDNKGSEISDMAKSLKDVLSEKQIDVIPWSVGFDLIPEDYPVMLTPKIDREKFLYGTFDNLTKEQKESCVKEITKVVTDSTVKHFIHGDSDIKPKGFLS